MKHVIVPIFVPHLGCPHQCVFCNQYQITGVEQGKWQPPSFEALAAQVEEWTRSSGTRPELAFYGGSFTAIDKKLQEQLLSSAARLKAEGKISAIRLSTRPDALGIDVLSRLSYYAVDTVEIGVQSLDDEVLEKAGRGHTAEQAEVAIRRVKAAGFKCGAQMMLMLPGDTPEKSLATGKRLAELAPDMVRIYPTVVIRGTQLATEYIRWRYRPWPEDDLLDTAAELLDIFDDADIPVIRVGLQPADTLSKGEVLAGPYHPALGELVKARRLRNRMQAQLSAHEDAPVTFRVAPEYLSQALGQHRENLDHLTAFCGQPVTVEADASITTNIIERK